MSERVIWYAKKLATGLAREKTSGGVDWVLEEYRRTGYIDALDDVSGYAQQAIKSLAHDDKIASPHVRRKGDRT